MKVYFQPKQATPEQTSPSMDKASFQLFINHELFLRLSEMWVLQKQRKHLGGRADQNPQQRSVDGGSWQGWMNDELIGKGKASQSQLAQGRVTEPPCFSVPAILRGSLPWGWRAQPLEGDVWVQILAQPLSCCVTICELLNHSGLIFSPIQQQ